MAGCGDLASSHRRLTDRAAASTACPRRSSLLPNGARLEQALLLRRLELAPHVPHLQLPLLRDSKDDPVAVRAQHAPRDALPCDGHRPNVPHERELVHDDRVRHAALERVDVAVPQRRHLRDLPRAVRAQELVDMRREVEGRDLRVELELRGAVGRARRPAAVVVGDVPDVDRARLVWGGVPGDEVLAVPRAPCERLPTVTST